MFQLLTRLRGCLAFYQAFYDVGEFLEFDWEISQYFIDWQTFYFSESEIGI